jgi:uroporphyrinogen decarboxylase
MELKNDLILRAARGEKVERTPVWLMRQAGRILPEYRDVRAKMGGFKELVESPEFACEVSIQPLDSLGVDAAIIFSDILVIPEGMGLPYKMVESRGPWFENTIQTNKDIDGLKVAQAEDVPYTIEAIKLLKRELNGRVPIIGFAGAPWTILAYMVEGSGSKTFSKAKKFLYTQPLEAHKLAQKITDSTINYLRAQVDAGADMLQLFDSWAGILSPTQYSEFSHAYIDQICNALKASHPKTPITVFAKGAFFALQNFAKTNCDTIGLDWNMDAAEARKIYGNTKTLQGNMDPCLLYADFKNIKSQTEKMLREFGPERHIANLGHGVYADINKDNVKCFVDTIKEFKFN